MRGHFASPGVVRVKYQPDRVHGQPRRPSGGLGRPARPDAARFTEADSTRYDLIYCGRQIMSLTGEQRMSEKKVIAVTGATGAQGGGLVRAIVADRQGPFVARAVTRKPESETARALAALGVEVVAGDFDDPPV